MASISIDINKEHQQHPSTPTTTTSKIGNNVGDDAEVGINNEMGKIGDRSHPNGVAQRHQMKTGSGPSDPGRRRLAQRANPRCSS
jgi:hypothetical protein